MSMFLKESDEAIDGKLAEVAIDGIFNKAESNGMGETSLEFNQHASMTIGICHF
jgi:hypothetical protein